MPPVQERGKRCSRSPTIVGLTKRTGSALMRTEFEIDLGAGERRRLSSASVYVGVGLDASKARRVSR